MMIFSTSMSRKSIYFMIKITLIKVYSSEKIEKLNFPKNDEKLKIG